MYMIVTNILAVGVTDRSDALNGLPIRLLLMETAAQAVRCLREENIDTVISRWELADMPDGMFLQKIIAAKPAIPTIAFIRSGSYQQEVLARSLGVSVVLDEDIDDECFRETVCRLLGVREVAGIKPIDGYSLGIDGLQEAASRYLKN